MSVAGNTLYSVELTWHHGILSERGWMHRMKSMVEDDSVRAVRRLRNGDKVFMHVYGNNLLTIREALLGELE